ncbi:type VII secretion-associated serine protease mycosin [Kitasatospora sp. GAS204A]|uniref:type VII secretion-associated serine protease mycosin n=1 Tax=unclassified Kitasatospora TaxID=2633591 RepID=UPI002475E5B3|nr:type VII secretion-associated serine protease mycosin [Kitasatospora sp. GAS204B]MDH6121514.1 type VII secretion-associated serine protease mycosin [Kitasatospora sp. GAS204B]
MAVLAAGALVWGLAAGQALADNIRDQQWALQAYKAATDVWPISQGDGVTVAVIDTGVYSDQQDLTGQVLPGADFSGAQTDGRVDNDGHGTGMASIIAGHGHGDQAGVMGLAPKAKILPVRVGLQDSGDMQGGPDFKFSDALRYAVDHGAKVVNMSFAAAMRTSPDDRAAVAYAVAHDVVLVAGTGNLGSVVSYPAAFPGVVAVGAIDRQGNVWDHSNYGPEVTLAAPGVGIYSSGNKSSTDYRFATGTSDATAYVSAIAALVRSKYPSLTAGQVIRRMITSAAAPPDHSKVPNDHYGYGIASPSKSLAANPAVDNGPKDNPLLTRVESQGAPDTSSPVPAPPAAGTGSGGSGTPVWLYGAGGGVLVLIVLGVTFLVRRGSRRPAAAPAGPAAYPHPPQQQYQPPQYPQDPRN